MRVRLRARKLMEKVGAKVVRLLHPSTTPPRRNGSWESEVDNQRRDSDRVNIAVVGLKHIH